MKLPFYGFEHVDLCTTHGDQVGGHYYVWLKSQRPDADALRDRKNQLPHDYVCPQAFRTPIPEELYPTAYIADKSCEWLDRYAAGERDQPFFLMTSFPDPHHPFTPPGKYWSMYRPQDMALPPNFDHGNRPLARSVAWALAQRESGKANTVRAGGVRRQRARGARGDGAELRHDRDDRRCDRPRPRQLAARGLADNTIVVFTTDHGDFLGDHRLMLKGPAHFDSITHVPFIWAEPGASARRAQLTFSAARSTSRRRFSIVREVQPYNGIQGESLLPAINGEGAPRSRATRW